MTIREVLDQQLAPGNSLGLLALLEDVKSGAQLPDIQSRAAAWIGTLNGEGAVPPPPKSAPKSFSKPAKPTLRSHSKKK